MVDGVKPPSSNRPPGDQGASPLSEKSNVRNFADARNVSASEAAQASKIGITAAQNCSKAELNDPERLESVVRASISEMVESEASKVGPLAPSQQQSVIDFLSQDPFIRQQIQNYLERVLT